MYICVYEGDVGIVFIFGSLDWMRNAIKTEKKSVVKELRVRNTFYF